MKNVDIKKRCKEDRIGLNFSLKTAFNATIFFFFTSNLFAQIPINGFCKLQTIETQPLFSKIFTLDYNLDNYTDLLLFGKDGKRIVLHRGEEDKVLSNQIPKFSYFPIDDLIPLYDNDTENGFYIFVSRKERLAGLVSFTKYGTMQILNQLMFDSYPSNIHTGDIDGDGKNEALISGPNFNGLSILKEDNFILRETKIVTGKVFSDAKLIDLDYDSISDVAAFDLLTNSLLFYYNTEFDGFRKYRSIAIGEEIDKLKLTDYNNDGYDDLFYDYSCGIEILMGDSVSTFKNRILFKTKVCPDEYTVRDFNKDGLNDIAFINKTDGDLFISFAKSIGEFYDPVHYLHNAGIEDLEGFENNNSEYLAVLNNGGEVYIISKFIEPEDEMSISIGGIPAEISCFNSFVLNTKDICYIDSYNNNLNLLINDKNKMYSKYYQFRLFNPYTNILIDDSDDLTRTFYMFSYGDKFIEIINLDFSTDEFTKDCLYTYSPIIDLRLAKNKAGNRKPLYALVTQDSMISLINYQYDNFKYSASVLRNLNLSVIDAGISFTDSLSFYSWSADTKRLTNAKLFLHGRSPDEGQIFTLPELHRSVLNMFIKTFGLIFPENDLPVSVINETRNSSLYIFNGTNNIKADFDETPALVRDKNQVSIFSNPIMRRSYLYLYDSGNLNLYSAEVTAGQNELKFYKLFESIHCNSYFVNNLFLEKTYLVFSEPISNSIKLKRIE
ncbi:hypothetical protein ACFLTH_02920 [Bacteroidota bacterium]